MSTPGSVVLERYRLIRPIGEGGMATVWLAADPAHEREVAVKLLRAELAVGMGADRFLREIRLTARLQHPHILPLLDSGALPDGRLCYVMPFVDGVSLRQRLEESGALPLDEALRLAGEVAGALGYAHAEGIVHRDVKPENILLSRGHALVADFGIAAATRLPAGERITMTGTSLGTPRYMAPEQAAGDPNVDARADVFALGCVTYEMLAGVPAFDGANPTAVLAAKLADRPPRIRARRAEVPEAVDEVLARAMAADPARRFPDAGAFTAALAAGAAVTPPRRRSYAIAAIALAAVALVGAAAIALRGRPTAAPAATQVRKLTASGDVRSVAPSPDGRSFAWVADSGRTVWVQDTTPGAQPRRILALGDSGKLLDLDWQDAAQPLVALGRWGGAAGFFEVPLTGGTPALVAPVPADAVFDVLWDRAASGTWVVAVGRRRIWTGKDLRGIPWAGGEASSGRMLDLPDTLGLQVMQLALSPDGGRLAMLVTGTRMNLAVMDLATGALAMRAVPWLYWGGLAWLDRRRLLVPVPGEGNDMVMDGLVVDAGDRTGTLTPGDTIPLGSPGQLSMGTARAGAPGTIVMSAAAVINNVVRIPAAGGTPVPLSRGTATYRYAACLRDGGLATTWDGTGTNLVRFRDDGTPPVMLARFDRWAPFIWSDEATGRAGLTLLDAARREWTDATARLVDAATGAVTDLGPGISNSFLPDGRPLLTTLDRLGVLTFRAVGGAPLEPGRFPAVRLTGTVDWALASKSSRYVAVPESSLVRLYPTDGGAPRTLPWPARYALGWLGDSVLTGWSVVPGKKAPDELRFDWLDVRTGTVRTRAMPRASLTPMDICANGSVIALKYERLTSDAWLVRLPNR